MLPHMWGCSGVRVGGVGGGIIPCILEAYISRHSFSKSPVLTVISRYEESMLRSSLEAGPQDAQACEAFGLAECFVFRAEYRRERKQHFWWDHKYPGRIAAVITLFLI